MKVVKLIANKANVYDEAEKVASYIGVKTEDNEKQQDKNAYDRIMITDQDRQVLERFWNEACNAVTEQLKEFVVDVKPQGVSHGVELDVNYELTLEMPDSFEDVMADAMTTSLHSYFVSYIVARWLRLTKPEESEAYGKDAAGALEDIESKAFLRKRPTR